MDITPTHSNHSILVTKKMDGDKIVLSIANTERSIANEKSPRNVSQHISPYVEKRSGVSLLPVDASQQMSQNFGLKRSAHNDEKLCKPENQGVASGNGQCKTPLVVSADATVGKVTENVCQSSGTFEKEEGSRNQVQLKQQSQNVHVHVNESSGLNKQLPYEEERAENKSGGKSFASGAEDAYKGIIPNRIVYINQSYKEMQEKTSSLSKAYQNESDREMCMISSSKGDLTVGQYKKSFLGVRDKKQGKSILSAKGCSANTVDLDKQHKDTMECLEKREENEKTHNDNQECLPIILDVRGNVNDFDNPEESDDISDQGLVENSLSLNKPMPPFSCRAIELLEGMMEKANTCKSDSSDKDYARTTTSSDTSLFNTGGQVEVVTSTGRYTKSISNKLLSISPGAVLNCIENSKDRHFHGSSDSHNASSQCDTIYAHEETNIHAKRTCDNQKSSACIESLQSSCHQPQTDMNINACNAQTGNSRVMVSLLRPTQASSVTGEVNLTRATFNQMTSVGNVNAGNRNTGYTIVVNSQGMRISAKPMVKDKPQSTLPVSRPLISDNQINSQSLPDSSHLRQTFSLDHCFDFSSNCRGMNRQEILDSGLLSLPEKARSDLTKQFVCKICNDEFHHEEFLKFHLNRKVFELTYFCIVCSRDIIFYNKCTFWHHILKEFTNGKAYIQCFDKSFMLLVPYFSPMASKDTPVSLANLSLSSDSYNPELSATQSRVNSTQLSSGTTESTANSHQFSLMTQSGANFPLSSSVTQSGTNVSQSSSVMQSEANFPQSSSMEQPTNYAQLSSMILKKSGNKFPPRLISCGPKQLTSQSVRKTVPHVIITSKSTQHTNTIVPVSGLSQLSVSSNDSSPVTQAEVTISQCSISSNYPSSVSQSVPESSQSSVIPVETFPATGSSEPLVSHTNEAILKKSCPVCKMRFSTDSEFTKHFQRSSFYTYPCNICHMTLLNLCHLAAHKTIHAIEDSESRVICPECGETFSDSKMIFEHLDSCCHFNVCYRMVCKCGQMFFSASGAKRHIFQKHLKALSSCRVCKKNFYHVDNLWKHHFRCHPKQELYTVSTVVFCDLCQEICSNSVMLQGHVEEEVSNYNKYKMRVYQCLLCNEAFVKPSELNSHMEVGHAHKPKRCTLCFTLFQSRQNLVSHIMNKNCRKIPPQKLHVCADVGPVINKEVPFHYSQYTSIFKSKKSKVIILAGNEFLPQQEHSISPSTLKSMINRENTALSKNKTPSSKNSNEKSSNVPSIQTEVPCQSPHPEKRQPPVQPIDGIKYQCHSCKVCLVGSNNFQRHKLHHTSDLSTGRTHCIVCKKMIADSSIRLHMEEHQKQGVIVCTLCHRRDFASMSLAREHSKNWCFYEEEEGWGEACFMGIASARKDKATGGKDIDISGIENEVNSDPSDVNSNESQPNLFPCLMCGLAFSSKSVKDEHVNRVHDGIRALFFCLLCKKKGIDKSFSQKRKVIDHLSRKHRIVETSIISKSFLEERQNISSGQVIPIEVSAKIDNIDAPPPKRLRLEAEGTFLCGKCGFTVAERDVFEQHIKSHNPKEEPQCPECGLCFTVKAALRKHVFAVHKIKKVDEYLKERGFDDEVEELVSDDDMEMAPVDIETIVTIDDGAGSKSRGQSKRKSVSRSDCPLECNVCYKRFSCETVLKSHIRSHGMAFIRSKRYNKTLDLEPPLEQGETMSS